MFSEFQWSGSLIYVILIPMMFIKKKILIFTVLLGTLISCQNQLSSSSVKKISEGEYAKKEEVKDHKIENGITVNDNFDNEAPF